jgi:hypothetical protein
VEAEDVADRLGQLQRLDVGVVADGQRLLGAEVLADPVAPGQPGQLRLADRAVLVVDVAAHEGLVAQVPGVDALVVQVRAHHIRQVAVEDPLHGRGDRVTHVGVDEQVVHVRPGAVVGIRWSRGTPPKSHTGSRHRLNSIGITRMAYWAKIPSPASKLARKRCGSRWWASWDSHQRATFQPGKYSLPRAISTAIFPWSWCCHRSRPLVPQDPS